MITWAGKTVGLLAVFFLWSVSSSWADLSAPTNLTATPLTSTKYQIAWTPPSNSTSNSLVITNGAITYQIRTLSADVTALLPISGPWTIKVQGRSATELSPAATTSITVVISAPTAIPTGVTADPQSNGIDLRWNPGTGTDSLRINWTDPATGQSKSILTSSTFAAIRGLQNNTSYTFSLAWTNSAGTGPATTITRTPTASRLALATAPTATALTNTSAQLSWLAVPGATFYAIYAGPSADYATLRTSVRPRVTAATSIVISPISTGWYAFILAGNLNGLSLITPVAIPLPTVAPPTQAPTLVMTPGVLSAAASWTSVPMATAYEVHWNVGPFDAQSASVVTSSTSPLVLTALTANLHYNMAVRGYNAGGSGPFSDPQSVVPLAEQTARSMQYLATGTGHSLALRPGGLIMAWGDNTYGELGDGSTTQRLTPVTVSGLTGMVAVSAGEYYSMGLKNDGTVWTWGRNEYGQIGDGTMSPRTTPYQVPGLTNITAIAAGTFHAVALRADGTLFAWGRNDFNQIDSSATLQYSTPVALTGLSNIDTIAAGYSSTMVLRTDGTLWAWGANDYGTLGNGTTVAALAPTQVSNLTNVVSIAVAGTNYVALKADGTVWMWGYNVLGNIGDGTKTTRLTPVQVSDLSNIVEIGTGTYHALALDKTGGLWGWGYNQSGQLGLGNFNGLTPNLKPVKILTNPAIVALSKGTMAYHSMALLNNWQILTWGLASTGQLANQSTSPNINVPTLISSAIFPPMPTLVITPSGTDTIISWTPIPGADSYSLKYMPSPYNGTQAITISEVTAPVKLPMNPTTPYTYSLSSGSRLVNNESDTTVNTEYPPQTYQLAVNGAGTFQVPSASYNSDYAAFHGNPAFFAGGIGLHSACNDGSGNTYDWSIGPYPDASSSVLYFQGPIFTGGMIRIGQGFSANGKYYGYYVCHIAGQPGSVTHL